MNLMTKKQVADLLQVSGKTIERYVKKGMPCIKVAGTVRFEHEKVMDWLRNQER